MVVSSGVPVELIGWHLSRGDAILNDRDIAQVLALQTPLAQFAIECNSHARAAYKVQTGEDGISLPDPIAMCLALDPSIGTSWSSHYLDVETGSELTRGMTVVDRLNVAEDDRNRAQWSAIIAKGKKARVCWTLDTARWKNALLAALRG
jgi:purine nucleosidase